MQRTKAFFGLLALLPISSIAKADFDSYIARPEPAYKWEKRGEHEMGGCKVYDLFLVSQVWQGHTWEHHLQLFVPPKPATPKFCALLNTGGNPDKGDEEMAARFATMSRAPFAVLYNIPKQPLYGGKTEDDLIVHTWTQFILTGDETWPLHFPMAKAVLKAMDALQAFVISEKLPPLEGFLVTGASKRGWTTWLVGASKDPRVKAIAPMVIDILNLPAQVAHQLEMFGGKFSEQIGEYTGAGLQRTFETPRGKRLVELEDPYSYRDRITIPKLLLLGTNDRYWTQDALNLYWDGLKGPKWVLYAPNSGHGLEDRRRVFNTLSAFIRATASGRSFPSISWEYRGDRKSAELTVKPGGRSKGGRIFRVFADSTDFRDGQWAFSPTEETRGVYTGKLSAPEGAFATMFGEVDYELDGMPFTLSTQVRVLRGK